MDAGDWQSAAQAALTQSPVETRELVASLAGGCSSRCKSEAEPLAMPKRSASGASQRCVAGELEIYFWRRSRVGRQSRRMCCGR